MIKTILCFCLSILLCACSPNEKDTNNYLSLTFTHVTDQENQFQMENYCYDLKTNDVKKMASFKYKAQYPLTYYDRANQKVYYTQRIGDSHNDEIHVYDCQTKTSKQISNGIFAVNSIFKVAKDKLAVVAVKDELVLRLFTIDTKKYTVEPMQIDGLDRKDFSIRAQYYNPQENVLTFGGYLASKEEKMLDDYNNELIDKYEYECPIYQYSFETKELKKILTETSGEITGLVASKDAIYYKVHDFINRNKKTIKYDVNSHKSQDIKELSNVYRLISIDNEDEEIYFVQNKERGSSSLVKMNLRTKKIEKLFHESIEGQINNGFIGF